MSPATARTTCAKSSFPRVSGDEPDAALKERAVALFSPRERG